MNKRLEVVSITFCDPDREPFPTDENSGGALVRFTPSPKGSTGKIFIRVVCRIIPPSMAQLAYSVRLLNPDAYLINGGDSISIKYIRDATTNVAVFLPIEIKNKKPLNTILPCDMKINMKDTSLPQNNPERTIRIKGFQ